MGELLSELDLKKAEEGYAELVAKMKAAVSLLVHALASTPSAEEINKQITQKK